MHLTVYSGFHEASLRELVRAVALDAISLPSLTLISSQARWRAWLADPEHRYQLVAVADDRLVGHVAVSDVVGAELAAALPQVSPYVREVASLFVHPAYRHRDIAGELLECAVAKVRIDEAIPGLVAYRDAPWALALYQKYGWRRVGAPAVENGVVVPLWLPPAS